MKIVLTKITQMLLEKVTETEKKKILQDMKKAFNRNTTQKIILHSAPR